MENQTLYQNTQYAKIILWALGLLTVINLVVAVYDIERLSNTLLIPLLLFFFIALLFYKLEIKVYDNHIELKYGIGLIKINLRIDQLEGIEVLRVPWYYGLGIRITPHGMLYNINTLTAVRIQYSTDNKSKTVTIGTNEPESLKASLQKTFKNSNKE